uniref:Uncharacterized protein n=2 Tax=Anguilla anguilla TaxID=7936 RepID=A0A0E9PCW2_ANGAN
MSNMFFDFEQACEYFCKMPLSLQVRLSLPVLGFIYVNFINK